MKINKQATFSFCCYYYLLSFIRKGKVSLYNGKVICLKSGHNFGYLEATDISKFAQSPRKFEILIFHCI